LKVLVLMLTSEKHLGPVLGHFGIQTLHKRKRNKLAPAEYTRQTQSRKPSQTLSAQTHEVITLACT
jgi:hypothetical protein